MNSVLRGGCVSRQARFPSCRDLHHFFSQSRWILHTDMKFSVSTQTSPIYELVLWYSLNFSEINQYLNNSKYRICYKLTLLYQNWLLLTGCSWKNRWCIVAHQKDSWQTVKYIFSDLRVSVHGRKVATFSHQFD